MSDYILSCCSTADLSREHLESRDIQCVFFHYFLDDKEYRDDLGQSMPLDQFYQAMANGAMTKTAQVNISEYLDFFTPFLEQGKDILHLTLSSGISGTVNSARNAAAIAHERYPERKIYIVDSLAASSGYGGRISKAAGVFGGVLNICPLMNVDYMGRLIPREKIRTKKKVIQAIVDKMEKYADGGTDYTGKVYMSNSACMEDARAVADLVEGRFPKMDGKVLINSIGTVIGSHTGPGTVALFFWGKKRED